MWYNIDKTSNDLVQEHFVKSATDKLSIGGEENAGCGLTWIKIGDFY